MKVWPLVRWATLSLLGGLACCAQAAPPPPPAPLSTAPVQHVKVYLIAPGGNGTGGRRVACNDSAVPFDVTLPHTRPALEGSLEALLALGGDPDRTGFHDALAPSRLTLTGIERKGPEVKVQLTGYLELSDPCESSRILAELTETGLQFPDVSHAVFLLDGKPISDLLQAK